MEERSGHPAFELTHRQKRLRSITVVIILFIAAMIAFSLAHPFFRPARPAVMTEAARKALAAQGIVILGYYTVVFALALSLVVIAWLYIREIRVQLAVARRDIWKKIVDEQAEARSRRPARQVDGAAGGGPPGGNGSGGAEP